MRILVVEDEKKIASFIKRGLKEKNYSVDVAFNGDRGLSLAEINPYDLIVLDIILPKMNGFEVLDALRKDENLKSVPVIILTNLETMDNIEKAINNGACSYLVKSNYTLNEIVEKIKQSLTQ